MPSMPLEAVRVASRADPWARYEESEAWANGLGRIDAASGHGPWPEELLRLAGTLNKL